MHTLRASLTLFASLLLGATTTTAQVAPIPGRIVNFSVRAFSGNGSNVLIAGFTLSGTSTRPMLLRAVGPGLQPFGVSNYMLDPELRLFHTPTQEMANDSWGENIDLAAVHQRLGAFELGDNSRDAAVLIPLAPGSYTAHARGRNGTAGEVLLELYDAAEINEGAPAIVNVSLRGEVPQNGVIIGGFVISPGAPKRVVLRAIGPSLALFNVPGALGNPRVRVFSGSTVILENDNWATGTDPAAAEAAFQAVGAFPISRSSQDAALVVTLPPGAYTAHVDDLSGASGIALMEIYDMEPPAPGDPVPSTPPGDPSLLPGVSVVALSNAMVEGTTPGTTVMLIRAGNIADPLRVKLAWNGTASADDHSGIPEYVTFPAGSATTTFIFGAWADNTWEPSEVLTISLVDDPAYAIQGRETHVVIRDNSPLNGTGWRGEYFANATLAGTPVLTRTDPMINFDWVAASPDPLVPANSFSVRWTGLFQVDTTQDYTFTTRTDDGVRLYVDDQLLINRFTNKGRTDDSATVRLAAGVRYRMRLEFYENTGNATAILYWQAAGMPRTTVPTNRVFVGNISAPAITSATSAFALVGGPFNYTITASAAPTSFGATGLPAGLTINTSTGVISGSPTVAGSFPVILSASNAQGVASELLALQVADAGATPLIETWTTAGTGFTPPTTPPQTTAVSGSLDFSSAAGTAHERVRGYITAPFTGNYTFWITSSGPSEFLMADSDQPGDLWPRAGVITGYPSGYTNEPGQKSTMIALTAGKRHYFEIRHRPGAGTPHVALAWARPGDVQTAPSESVPAYTLSRFNELTADSDGRLVYLASLRPPDGVASPASGTMSLLYNETAGTATLAMRFSALSSAQTAAYLYVGPIGVTGPLIQALPNGNFSSFEWQIRDSGALTAQDIKDALRDGLLYVVVHTGNFPEGELRGQFGAAVGSARFTPPADAPTASLTLPDADAASRFLAQTTFGATQTEIDRVQPMGVNAWLDEQFAQPASYDLAYMDLRAAEYALLDPPGSVSQDDRQRTWWDRAVRAPDQLRQRMAFALSEILVVSDVGVLNGEPIALTVYYDMLRRDAFGNFRTLLENVTRSPAMGNYLSMIRNRRPDPSRGIYPDENYAREVMQLFTIGLNKLHPDGTLVLDSNGLPIPTYSQESIVGLAHVFTGWAYFSTDANPSYLGGARDFRNPMMMYESNHDTGNKRLLESAILPGGAPATGTSDLAVVLDMLFNHPNVGPFIARQLIQRFVTSNPSPGYVYRVARVFANNGSGVRGDLQAVLRAVLTDYEARSPQAATAQGYGKVREGLIRLTQLWRAFNGTATDGRFNYTQPQNNLSQAALRSPTVFNFFEPGYIHPGVLASAGLVAPEFQITSEISVVNLTNNLRSAVFTNVSGVTLDLTVAQNLAGNPAGLVDWLDSLLMNGAMSDDMRTTVINAVTAISATTPLERARTALNLITVSPEFSIQK